MAADVLTYMPQISKNALGFREEWGARKAGCAGGQGQLLKWRGS